MGLLSAEERIELRNRSIAAWERGKALHTAAEVFVSRAQTLRAEAQEIRSARCRADQAAVLRVDGLLEGRFLDGHVAANGVGLALATRISRIATFHEALHVRLPVVWTARDPASALGIAIMNQPDLGLVDDELPRMAGLDVVELLRSYAPRTRFVLFSADDQTVERARLMDVATCEPDPSTPRLLSAIDAALAS